MKLIKYPVIAYAFVVFTNLLHEAFHYIASGCNGSISLTSYGFGGYIHYTAQHGTFESLAGGLGVFVVYVVIWGVMCHRKHYLLSTVFCVVALVEFVYAFFEGFVD